MKEITDANFIINATPIMNQVANDHFPIVITREAGKPLVLLSLKGYEAIEELIYEMGLLSTYSYKPPTK